MPDLEQFPSSFGSSYTLQRVLSHDALGVLLAATTPDGAPVAIRIIAPDIVRLMISPAAFVAELERASHIQHAALLRTHDVGMTADGDLYYATEFIEGATARDLADRDQRPTAQSLATAGGAIADALAAAHAAGVVHGCIAPTNIYWSARGACLAELGVYRALAASGIGTRDVMHLASTVRYMSPEQLDGEPADARSDIYSLGATWYELLTGRAPFGGRTTSTMMASVLAEEPAATRAASDEQEPGQVVAAVLRAIERAPDDRWPSAAAFSAAIRATPSSSDGFGNESSSTRAAPRIGCLPIVIIFVVTAIAAWRVARGAV